MRAAEILVAVLGVYGAAGVVFAVAFVLAGIERVDPVARHAPLGFRLIVAPGAAALWPIFAVRWVKAVRS